MSEGRRQSYLAALGLPLWAARHLLPGAMPAAIIDFVPYEDEAPVAHAEAEEAAAAELVSVAAAREQPLAQTAAPSEAPATPPERAALRPAPVPARMAVAPAVAGSAEFPQFTFWFKALPSGWQLLIALGDVPDLSAREHQLLEQVEAVLGGGAVAPTRFNWPLNNNPAIPRDAQSASEAVAAFLSRQRKHGVRYLLLGQELLPYLRQAFADAPFAVGDSPALLLEEPLRKRALWQSLGGLLA